MRGKTLDSYTLDDFKQLVQVLTSKINIFNRIDEKIVNTLRNVLKTDFTCVEDVDFEKSVESVRGVTHVTRVYYLYTRSKFFTYPLEKHMYFVVLTQQVRLYAYHEYDWTSGVTITTFTLLNYTVTYKAYRLCYEPCSLILRENEKVYIEFNHGIEFNCIGVKDEFAVKPLIHEFESQREKIEAMVKTIEDIVDTTLRGKVVVNPRLEVLEVYSRDEAIPGIPSELISRCSPITCSTKCNVFLDYPRSTFGMYFKALIKKNLINKSILDKDVLAKTVLPHVLHLLLQ